MTLVTLEEKGRVKIEAIPLCPMRDLREVRGTYETVTSRKFYQGMQVEDYLHVILTDEEDVPEAMGKLPGLFIPTCSSSAMTISAPSQREKFWGQSGLRRRPPWPFSRTFISCRTISRCTKFRRNF